MHLLECGFCEILLLVVSTQVRTIQADEDESTSFPNFQPQLDQLPFPEVFHPPIHFSLTFHATSFPGSLILTLAPGVKMRDPGNEVAFHDDSKINLCNSFAGLKIFPRRFCCHVILTNA